MQATLDAPECSTLDLADFDLDFEVDIESPDANVQITSVFLCTPGCGQTGSFNSFCC